MSDSEKDNDRFWMERRDNRRKVDWRRKPSWRERRREWLLRDWFGAARAPEEIVERQPPAHWIGEDVDRFLAKSGGEERTLLDRLRRDWSTVAGADIAKYTEPYSLRNEQLLVEVSHPAWLYVLEREHKPVLVERVQAAAPGQIRDVRLIPRGRRSPNEARGNRDGAGGSNRGGAS